MNKIIEELKALQVVADARTSMCYDLLEKIKILKKEIKTKEYQVYTDIITHLEGTLKQPIAYIGNVDYQKGYRASTAELIDMLKIMNTYH